VCCGKLQNCTARRVADFPFLRGSGPKDSSGSGVGQKFLNHFHVFGIDYAAFSEGSFPFSGLFRQDVAGVGPIVDDLAGTGFFEPFGRPSIRLGFGHKFTSFLLV
jgi:hypothetical protein